jgi:hypothetical protein
VTPRAIRLRKTQLDGGARRKSARQANARQAVGATAS